MIPTLNRHNGLLGQRFNQLIGRRFSILTVFVIDVFNVFSTDFLHGVFSNIEVAVFLVTNSRDITKYRTTLDDKVFQDWVLERFIDTFVNGETSIINQGYDGEVFVLTIVANSFHKGIQVLDFFTFVLVVFRMVNKV